MWSFFNKSRDRFSLGELRTLTDQLTSCAVIDDSNKKGVVETLRSIAELVIWGDQNDPQIFEFFMDNKLLAQFCHVLQMDESSNGLVAVQVLQALNIMIQNFKSETAIYYMFSHEYINSIISFPFNFRNEEQLNYYISFLRTVSMKMDSNTAQFLLFEGRDGKKKFPLYMEAIKFFHHEENMVRIAIRNLTLNIYNVDVEEVRSFVSSRESLSYLEDLVGFLRQQMFNLDTLVTEAASSSSAASTVGRLESCVAEITDLLFYCNDVIHAGIPALTDLLTSEISRVLVRSVAGGALEGPSAAKNASTVSPVTALFLLSQLFETSSQKQLLEACIESMVTSTEDPLTALQAAGSTQAVNGDNLSSPKGKEGSERKKTDIFSWIKKGRRSGKDLSGRRESEPDSREALAPNCVWSRVSALLYDKNDHLVFAALCVILSLMNNKHIDSWLKDILGIQSNLETLSAPILHILLQSSEVEVLWRAVWIAKRTGLTLESNSVAMKSFQAAFESSKRFFESSLLDCWVDFLPAVITEEWKKGSQFFSGEEFPEQPAATALLQRQTGHPNHGDSSSIAIGERTRDSIRKFVALSHAHSLLHGRQPSPEPPLKTMEFESRGSHSGLLLADLKEGSLVPITGLENTACRVAFERGKERDVFLVVASQGPSGSLSLVEKTARPKDGLVRVVAPLAGARPAVDKRHPKWLHLRIRAMNFPQGTASNSLLSMNGAVKPKPKKLADGRWTLAFPSEQRAMEAYKLVVEEMFSQANAARRILEPVTGPLPPFSAQAAMADVHA